MIYDKTIALISEILDRLQSPPMATSIFIRLMLMVEMILWEVSSIAWSGSTECRYLMYKGRRITRY